MSEIWKDIKEYEGYYQVSNIGRVKRLERVSRYKCGDSLLERTVKERVMKNVFSDKGYYKVQLWKDGINKNCRIHRLVAIAFIPNHKKLSEVNHKDLDKINNNVSNLEWVTTTENRRHAVKNGVIFAKPQYGEKNPFSKLTEEKVKEIKKRKQSFASLGREFGVNPSTISKIIKGICWKKV